ncbi:MAG: GHMP kinase [Selenomonas sp.]|nr:GHMP kinase [Selenomonas sp.]
MDLMVRVPGSCGEFVQGVAQGKPFLGTCPIDWYTQVEVSGRFSGVIGLGEKSQKAMELTLKYIGERDFPWGVRLTSELPRGKGMASSSADIAAIVVAVMETFHQPWSDAFIMEIAAQIEPTDGIFCPGIVLMDHIKGKVWASFSEVPALRAAIFDLGGTVDTCAFHLLEKHRTDREDLFQAFQRVMLSGQIEKAIQLATKSAFLNQEILYKEKLARLWQLGQQAGAEGINAAHSGTVLGLWWKSDMAVDKISQQAEQIAQALAIRFMGLANLRSGGVEVSRE